MSVKDRIAMWNNMSAGSNSTTPPPKTNNNFVFKPQPQQQQQHTQQTPQPSSSTAPKHEVDTVTIVRPSDLKKKAQMEQSAPVHKTNQFSPKPMQASYKPAQPVKRQNSSSNPANQFSVQSPTIPKPSDIKKQFQQQITGNNFHFIAPIPIKKVESITIESKQSIKTDFVIETEVPRVSVKQSAQKLGMFYQKKAGQESKPKETIQVVPEVHEDKHQQHQQQVIPPQHHAHQQEKPPKEEESAFVLPTEPEPPAPAQQPTENKEESNQEMDLALRLKNRNKKRRINFDSDED